MQISCPKIAAIGEIASKLQRVCWRRALLQEEGTRGNAVGKSYGNGIALVWVRVNLVVRK